MGIKEIQALNAKRTGYVPKEKDHVPVTHSGPKEKKLFRYRPEKVEDEAPADGKAKGKGKGAPKKRTLKQFFAAIKKLYKPDECGCWECGVFISQPFVGHAIAHIFPKNDFKSVATHEDNYLILGAGCCHDKSHTIAKFCRMKVWREAVERFLRFEHLLTEKERSHKYYKQFVEAARKSFPELFDRTQLVEE